MKQIIITVATFLLAGVVCAQRTTAEAYIAQYSEAAMQEMMRSGVPAAITLAQGIHESESGNSELAQKSNNHFGIKCKDTWLGEKVYHDDDARGECFRKYGSVLDSYADHSNFLRVNQRYASLFELDPADYEGWAKGLKKAGYATNPRYAQLLINLVEKYHLNDYTVVALQKMGKPMPENYVFASATPPPAPAAPTGTATPQPAPAAAMQAPVTAAFPEGIFRINETRVIYAKAGTSLLAIAENNGIELSKLLDFNDLEEEDGDILTEDALVYLQRKRKQGAVEFHIVQQGENLYDICQKQGIRYDSLLELNNLDSDAAPAPGEKIYLKTKAPSKPKLLSR
jgi:LysM repeat protein